MGVHLSTGTNLKRKNDYTEPIILDCAIDATSTEPQARDDQERRVYIPAGQVLVIDTEEGQIKTMRESSYNNSQ